jgi:signal peptidase
LLKGKKERLFLSGTKNVLYITLILISVFFTLLMMGQEKYWSETPTFGDYKLMIVMSGSMKPAFDAGSLIVVKRINPDMINTGDIITYFDGPNSSSSVTHRVMEIVERRDGTFFITKGDANDTKDFFPVPEHRVIGKVTVAIPFVGYILGFPGFKTGVLVFLVLSIFCTVIGEFRAVQELLGRKGGIKFNK